MAEKKKIVDIGGQAVLEGVMMKAPDAIAISVRRENGDIARSYERYQSPSKKHPWMGWPVVRGVVNMAQMLMLGMRTLEKSTQMLGIQQEEPSRFEKWLSKVFGKDIEKVVMGMAVVLAVGLSLLLFMVIPNFVASMLNRVVDSLLVVNLCTGVVRIAILIGYIGLT
ncbi:MAG TPA: DUF1385 domain-containing protein, partial [Clostridia bacterium]|nr:DUF1385 domain-containing protein [Clostridia bacterium]